MAGINYPKLSAVLYYYAKTSKGNFPGQITISAESNEEFDSLFTPLMENLISEAGEDDAVSYEPREVSAAAYNKGGGGGTGTKTAVATPPDPNIPNCPIHGT